MGREFRADQGKGHPPGFFSEVNAAMLEDMWLELAQMAHPDRLEDAHRDDPEAVFDLLGDVGWDLFWQVFPLELREHGGSFVDELDALALLLAAPGNRLRFQRYFERYARGGAAAAQGGGQADEAAAAPGLRLGVPLLSPDGGAGQHARRRLEPPALLLQQQQQQQQQQDLPVRRRGQQQQPQHQQQRLGSGDAGPSRRRQQQPQQQQQQQQQQWRQAGALPAPPPPEGPVAYVSPAAPGRLLAATQAPTGGATAAGGGVLGTLPQVLQLPGLPPAPGFIRLMMSAFGITLAGAAADDAAAAPGGAGAGAGAAAGARLTGRRRTWQEACDPDGRPVAAAAAAAAAAPPPPPPPPPPPQQQQHRQRAAAPALAAAPAAAEAVDNSAVWRAVHDWLTADDEALLSLVMRLLPYSFEGRLRTEAETRAQLEQLACSRPVPQQVVRAIADRLGPSTDIQLLRVTAASGYSRRAAAAAAALAATSRTPYYVQLAGCFSEDEVQAAIMRAMFGERQQQRRRRRRREHRGWPQGEQAEQQVPLQQGLQQQQQQQQQPGMDGLPGGSSQPSAASGAGADAVADEQQQQQHAAAPADDGGGGGRSASPPPLASSDEGSEDGEQEEDDSGSDSGDDGSGTCEDSEQLAAHLTLLGSCSRAPLLLVLDESDAAQLPGDGQPFRGLLVRLLCHLPHAVVVVVGSLDSDAFTESALLRQQGRPAHYAMPDGSTICITSHKLSSSLCYSVHFG